MLKVEILLSKIKVHHVSQLDVTWWVGGGARLSVPSLTNPIEEKWVQYDIVGQCDYVVTAVPLCPHV